MEFLTKTLRKTTVINEATGDEFSLVCRKAIGDHNYVFYGWFTENNEEFDDGNIYGDSLEESISELSLYFGMNPKYVALASWYRPNEVLRKLYDQSV